MKKLVYLVAPLMVLPCMMSCNKAPTHKVTHISPFHLTFTTMNDKKLEDSSFNEGQDFKFKVKAEQDQDDPTHLCTVIQEGIQIYVGGATLPLLDGYSISYTKDDRTEAVVTIEKSKTTADMIIEGIAAKEGNYIYSVPLLYNVRMPEGSSTYGWYPIGGKEGKGLELHFEGKEEHAKPTNKSFLITDDGFNFYYDDGTTTSEMYKAFYNLVDSIDQSSNEETVVKIKNNAINTGYLLIAARTGDEDSTFLDSLTWDDIKELSVNGLAPYILNAGDEKHIKFKTIGDKELNYTVRILGFNHDYIDPKNPEGTKVGITFQFKTVLSFYDDATLTTFPFSKAWNETEGGGQRTAADFEQSSLNKFLHETILGYLPEDLQRNIVEVNKRVGKYNKVWEAQNYNARLFPLSAIEASQHPRTEGGSSINYVSDEGTTYALFKDDTTEYPDLHETRKAFRVDSENGAAYWLRSPSNSGYRGYANYILDDGHYSGNAKVVDKTTLALAPAFCI